MTDLLKEDTVEVNVEVDTWEEAGQAAGRLLLKTGGVEEQYLEAIIESVKKFGPYIVLAPGIALFHARPEDGVNNVCMSLVTLAKPINFIAGEKDPVRLAFAFGAVDRKAHLQALSELVFLLQDRTVLDKIQNSQTKQEVLQLIKEKLKTKPE